MLNPISTFNSSVTHSTGPKPSQLVPKFIECALESQNHQIGPNKPIIIFHVWPFNRAQILRSKIWSNTNFNFKRRYLGNEKRLRLTIVLIQNHADLKIVEVIRIYA